MSKPITGIDLSSLTIDQFIDLQGGISNDNRKVLIHQYKTKGSKTFNDWHAVVSKDVELSEPKDFTVTDKK